MKKLNENAVQVTAPLAVRMPAADPSEMVGTHADAVLPPDSRKSALGIVSEAHDSSVRDLLNQVMEYSKEHPGMVKNIRLRERTFGVLMPDNGDKALDEFEKHGSSQVQVLRNVCDGNVMAIVGKESTIDFNIADSEQ